MAYQQPVVEPKTQTMPAEPVPVEPKAGAPAPTEDTGGDIPDEVAGIPAIQGLLVGQPAAVSASIADFANRPEGKLIAANAKPLMGAGFGLFRSKAGDTGVLFNMRYISGAEIQAADQAGTLQEIAPPFDAVNQSLSQAGQNHPMMSMEGTGPEGYAVAPVPQAPTAMIPPAPAATQRAKSQALVPQGPISGARPGAGRILNSILRPVN